MAVKQYVQDVMERRFGDPIEGVTIALTAFIDTGSLSSLVIGAKS